MVSQPSWRVICHKGTKPRNIFWVNNTTSFSSFTVLLWGTVLFTSPLLASLRCFSWGLFGQIFTYNELWIRSQKRHLWDGKSGSRSGLKWIRAAKTRDWDIQPKLHQNDSATRQRGNDSDSKFKRVILIPWNRGNGWFADIFTVFHLWVSKKAT